MNDCPAALPIDDASPFFADLQFFNDKKPNKIIIGKTIINTVRQQPKSELGLSFSLKYASIKYRIVATARKKYATLKMKYNRSCTFIIFGVSSIFSSLGGKYHRICINFFGGFV